MTPKAFASRGRRHTVWAAIRVATGAVVLDDDAFDDMIPSLDGGTVFFIVLVPAALFRKRP